MELRERTRPIPHGRTLAALRPRHASDWGLGRVFSDFPVRDSASFATFTDQAIFEQPIERVIENRRRVREEFDRLVRVSEKPALIALIEPETSDRAKDAVES